MELSLQVALSPKTKELEIIKYTEFLETLLQQGRILPEGLSYMMETIQQNPKVTILENGLYYIVWSIECTGDLKIPKDFTIEIPKILLKPIFYSCLEHASGLVVQVDDLKRKKRYTSPLMFNIPSSIALIPNEEILIPTVWNLLKEEILKGYKFNFNDENFQQFKKEFISLIRKDQKYDFSILKKCIHSAWYEKHFLGDAHVPCLGLNFRFNIYLLHEKDIQSLEDKNTGYLIQQCFDNMVHHFTLPPSIEVNIEDETLKNLFEIINIGSLYDRLWPLISTLKQLDCIDSLGDTYNACPDKVSYAQAKYLWESLKNNPSKQLFSCKPMHIPNGNSFRHWYDFNLLIIPISNTLTVTCLDELTSIK